MSAEDAAATPAAPRAWNPRYVAYARAHGRAPEAMLAHDVEAWPGGKMAGFIVWLAERWEDFARERGVARGVASLWYQREFDAWLSRRGAEPSTTPPQERSLA